MLGLPLAFILSQDQTLHCMFVWLTQSYWRFSFSLLFLVVYCYVNDLYSSRFLSKTLSVVCSDLRVQKYKLFSNWPNVFEENLKVFFNPYTLFLTLNSTASTSLPVTLVWGCKDKNYLLIHKLFFEKIWKILSHILNPSTWNPSALLRFRVLQMYTYLNHLTTLFKPFLNICINYKPKHLSANSINH